MEEINIQNNTSKKTKLPILLLILLMLSLGMNIFLFLRMNDVKTSVSGGYFRFIELSEKEPIDINVQDSNVIIHYIGLRDTVEQEIREYNAEGKVGFFLQDVKTGAWTGINEREGFTPTSLLKIPIMMAILKKVEREEINLEDKITIIQNDIDERSGTLYEKGVGAQISIGELLEEMITYSDNTAKNALKRQLSSAEIDTVFIHVGIPNPYIGINKKTVSPRDYTRLFKSLYYSTFLQPSLSERALDLTTDTQEESLIPGGVPPEIQVAHKFGIFGDRGLHDCGIVYHQENPYFLCIMTKDLELTQSSELIRKISKDVFEFVDKKS